MPQRGESIYQKLVEHAREVALLTSIEGLLGWDERTMLPQRAGPYRAEQVTRLAGLVHARQTEPQVGQWLDELADWPPARDEQSDVGATVRWLRRRYEKKIKLPRSLVEALARTAVVGQQTWAEARKEADFSRLAPVLKTTFQLKREQADALGYSQEPYDALLDEFEPFETTSRVAEILASLDKQLQPLLDAILGSAHRPRGDLLNRPFPLSLQDAFGRSVAERMGFDFHRGRLDTTDHPFCTTLGPHDVRITTRYDQRNFASGLFSILHEAGHGMYEQGLPSESFGLPLAEAVSLGIHESQSRLWENQVGRSLAFWHHFYGEAQRTFAPALSDVPREDFFFAINEVRPSAIRVEADEATYNLHIVIRFQLERALLDGDLPVDDLPAAWNEAYQKRLSLWPQDDAEGVLQDIHWPAGLVGYFPTYALGNLYAAQLIDAADAALGGLGEPIGRGEFAPLRTWLREQIHCHGQRYTAGELVERATGRTLSPGPLLDHLSGKLRPLYQLP